MQRVRRQERVERIQGTHLTQPTSTKSTSFSQMLICKVITVKYGKPKLYFHVLVISLSCDPVPI